MDAVKPLTIRLFGHFEALVEGEPLRKLRTHRGNAVLAMLALRRGRSVDRSYLASAIWPDSETSDALYSLRRTLTDLRHALGIASTAIKSPSSSSLQLDLEVAWVDLVEFEASLKLGTDASIERAAEVYRGPLLSDWGYEWINPDRSIFDRMLLESLHARVSLAEIAGETGRAVELLRALSRIDPHDETVFLRLAKAHVRMGNVSGAQKAYEEFKRRLRHDLETAPSDTTQDAIREIFASTAIQSDPSRFVGGNLPLPTNRLIGRRKEFCEIVESLGQHRPVTLVGSGGVGKTRLALEVLRDLATGQSMQAIAVDLLAVRDPDQVYEAFAAATKAIDPDPNASPRTVALRLADSEATILLDNCEHLIEPIRRLVQELADHCPKLRILSTSQAPIGVAGEHVVRIVPMPVPDVDEISFEQAVECDAIALMAQCITKAKGTFQLNDRNFRSVCRICRTLDGVPLAIELAATRARLLSLDQIAGLLEDRFRLLRTNERGLDARHQTLEATMEWSYSLLSDDEKALLQTASAFVGHWTSESAAKVHVDLDSYQVLDVLERLVDRSLVIADPVGELPRFRLLDSVRQYAAQRLADRDELVTTRTKHLKWFTELAETAAQGFMGRDQRFWVERVEAEYENFLGAIAWAKRSRDRTGLALRLASSLMRFWWIQGKLTAGRETLARVLEFDGAEECRIPYARALYAHGALCWSQGDNKDADQDQTRALEIFRQEGDMEGAAGSLRNLSQVVRNLGRPEQAIEYGREAIAAYRQVGNGVFAANTLVDLGVAMYDQLKFEEARAYLEEAIEYGHTNGLTPLEAVALINLGGVFHSCRLFLEAKDAYERAQRLYETIGGRILSTMATISLGSIHAELGQVDLARSLVRTGLDTFLELGEKRGVCVTIDYTALIAVKAGEFELAAALFGAVDRRYVDIDAPRSPAERPTYEAALVSCKDALGNERFDDVYRAGAEAPLTEMVQKANAWLNET